jgi:hypothetical protein
LSAGDAAEHQRAMVDAHQYFHPSFLAECDYRVRFMADEPWPEIAHQAITVYLFAIHQNAAARPPHPHVDLDELVVVLNEYRARLAGSRPTVAEHLDVARHVQERVLRAAPSCDDRWTALTAEVLRDVAACGGGNKLKATVGAAVENATHLLLDAPATRLDALSFIIARRQEQQAALVAPAEGADALTAWLGDLRRAAGQARLNQFAELLTRMSTAVEHRPDSEDRVFDGDWNQLLAHCARCGMIFAAISPVVLDDSCPTISSGTGMIFFKRSLNRATCRFCGLESHLEGPGFLYWRARNLLVYRLPLTSLGKDETMELCRPAIESMREGYMSRLPAEQRAEFEHAVEVVAHGWREWLYAVQMGDVIPEDHVVLAMQAGSENGRLLVDITKQFMRELEPDEYRDVDPVMQQHIEKQMADLDPDEIERLTRAVVEDVRARLESDAGEQPRAI